MEYTYQNQDLELSYEITGTRDDDPRYDTWSIDSLEIYKDGKDITKVVERLDRMQKGLHTIMADIMNQIYEA